jgi:hypothetical protein
LARFGSDSGTSRLHEVIALATLTPPVSTRRISHSQRNSYLSRHIPITMTKQC